MRAIEVSVNGGRYEDGPIRLPIHTIDTAKMDRWRHAPKGAICQRGVPGTVPRPSATLVDGYGYVFVDVALTQREDYQQAVFGVRPRTGQLSNEELFRRGREHLPLIAAVGRRLGTSDAEIMESLHTFGEKLYAIAENLIKDRMVRIGVDRIQAVFTLHQTGVFEERDIRQYAGMTWWEVEEYFEAHREYERPL